MRGFVDAVAEVSSGQILHFPVRIKKSMIEVGRCQGSTGHLACIVDAVTDAVAAAQRAEIRHPALAVKEGMITNIANISHPGNLPGVVNAEASGLLAAQVSNGIENICCNSVAPSKEEGQEDTRGDSHLLFSCVTAEDNLSPVEVSWWAAFNLAGPSPDADSHLTPTAASRLSAGVR